PLILKIISPGYLQKQLSQVISLIGFPGVAIIPKISLVTGDIDKNNQLDIEDYNALVDCFGSKQNSSNCHYAPTQQSPGADIDDDGMVGGADYNLFLREVSVQPGG